MVRHLSSRRGFLGSSLAGVAGAAHAAYFPPTGNTLFQGNQLEFDLYYDSVNGNDANSGAMPGLAKQTPPSTFVAGKRYGFARGSYWRAQLGTQGLATANVTIGAYGSGRKPIFDCADVVPAGNWTKTPGRTNIWQCSAITVPLLDTQYPSMWQDGVRIRWIDSLDNLDAASGIRFYTPNPATGTSLVLYVNADPTTDGHLYETAVRYYGLISAGANWQVYNLHTMRNLANDGSFVLSGIGSAAWGILAEDGTKHNMFLGRNVVGNDCIAWKHDWADRTPIALFVSYDSDARGYVSTYNRCIAKGEPAKTLLAQLGSNGINGFLCHSGGGVIRWDAITYNDCSAFGVQVAFSNGDVVAATHVRPMAQGCEQLANQSASSTLSLTDPYIDGVAWDVQAKTGIETSTPTITVDGMRTYTTLANDKGDVYTSGSGQAVTVTGSVFARAPGSTGVKAMLNGTGSTLNQSQNIIQTATSTDPAYKSLSGATVDNNVYSDANADFLISGTSYATFALYRAANPSLDVHSVTGDPLLANPAAGNFNVGAGSPAIALGAGLARPNIVYTPIPSDAALAAM